MSKFSRNVLLSSAAIFGITLVLASSAVAADAPETQTTLAQTTASSKQVDSKLALSAQSTQKSNTPAQATEVAEPSNVAPNNSTSQTPSFSGERYGCVSGYSDRTYQGNQPLTRYEFAAALNACLNQIEQLITRSSAERVTQEEFAVPTRQLETLGLELDDLQMRVDRLDSENRQQ